MTKKFFMIMIVFAALLAIGLLVMPNSNVQAQAGGPGCTDSAGAPAECTPTPESGGGSGGGGGGSGGSSGNPPVIVNNATPTVSALGKQDWSGKCYPSPADKPFSFSNCIAALENACNDTGGSTSIGNVEPDGGTTVSCTYSIILEPTPLPLSSGPEEDDLIGTCSEAQGNVLDCLGELQRQCEDGLLVIKVDLYATGGTSYKVYCIPHEEAPKLDLPYKLPDPDGSTEDNWTGGCYGDDVDVCVNDLASLCESEGGDISVWYDDDGGAGAYCENQSEASQPAPTEMPEIVAAPIDDGNTEGNEDWEESCTWNICLGLDISCWIDGGTGSASEDGQGGYIYSCNMPEESSTLPPSSWLPWTIGVIVVAVFLWVRDVTKTRSKDKDKKWIEIESMNSDPKSTDSNMRQTKEHVLLNKDDSDSSSANKPKPKPTLPPSQPKPSGGTKGDFNSDGDVDGSDFNP